MEVTLYNKGIPGQSSEGGRERFAIDVAALQPDYVLIYFGVNDTLNEAVFVALPRFLENLSWMIHESKKIGATPVLCTMHHCIVSELLKRHQAEVYLGEDPNDRIDRYNAAIRELASLRQVRLADFAKATEPAGIHADCIDPDGVHLTPQGYRLLAETFWNQVKSTITNGSRIVCLGDSLTFGVRMEGAGTAEGLTYPGWIRRLAEAG